MLVADDVLFILSVGVVRIAVILFYRRIFANQKVQNRCKYCIRSRCILDHYFYLGNSRSLLIVVE